MSRAWLASLLIVGGIVAYAIYTSFAEATLAERTYLPLLPAGNPINHDRFGLAIVGPRSITHTVAVTGVSWWYAEGRVVPTASPGHGVAHTEVNLGGGPCCRRVPAATLQAGARATPGGYWLIGNEPNIPGQDNITPSQYATELHYYATTIKAVDPTAVLIGPNVLNWERTCPNGCNTVLGRDWTEQFRAAYQEQYGTAPPFDIWGIHLYALNWASLPMDQAADVLMDESELTGFHNYLTAIPSEAAKPIWITEFGLLWAQATYPIIVQGGCAIPINPHGECYGPSGSYDTVGVNAFLTSLIGWFTQNAEALHLGKWFIYGDHPIPDTYATTFEGISLLTDGTSSAALSSAGIVYQRLGQ